MRGASLSSRAPAVQTPAPPGAELVKPAPAALWAEGAEYADALVLDIRAAAAEPAAIGDLVLFLAAGPMLAGACAVLHRAIREGADRA